MNLKAEICEYGDQREGIICDMIINCVNNRKCANEENITRIKIKLLIPTFEYEKIEISNYEFEWRAGNWNMWDCHRRQGLN